jgi:hypothetical protein
MAFNQVGIYNQALSAIGTRSSVSGLLENSREREICDIWYESTRDSILKAADWATVRGSARLALLTERDYDEDWVATDPEPDWRYVYGLPSDFLYPRFITSYARFAISTRSSQKVLLTDVEDVILTYLRKEISVSLWDISLYEAITFGLAARIAQPLTGKNQKARDMAALANVKIMEAREFSANADNVPVDSMPDWMIVRGIVGSVGYSNYIYPYGSLMSVGGVGSA